MKAEFYKKDLEHVNFHGEKVVEKDVLHFKFQQKLSTGEVDFDDKATEEHKKEFPDAYEAFLKSEEPKKELPLVTEEKKDE